ncbi:unnamed protein product [Rotaria sp. Silwood1]|nr:unnamed protein product [Rotaria sp. Silwood1]CAF4775362.1 unnamed protein product [Rotaria sp. Silwood1]CAF4815096.1 unnamed protein product [Rotaria sp. Silwood1]
MATKTESGRKLALVIGIGKYEHCEELQNPENDANDMSSILESIDFIVTKKLHLKRAEMQHVLIDFEHSIEPGDMVLFYFAGHGVQWEVCIKDQNYLIFTDTPNLDGAALNKSAINAQNILDTLSDRNPYVTIFLLDCCRKYHLRNPQVNARDPGASEPKSIGLKAMHKAGTLIAFACAPGTIAIEGKGERNGLFTKHLLKNIKTANEDIQMILRDVTNGVIQESESKQIPFVTAALLKRDIYLYSQQTKRPHKPEISDQDLNLDEEIGCGAFGTVYRAEWISRHNIVAVKRLHLTQLDKEAQKEFFNELSLMHSIHYPHIIMFYGACTERGKYALKSTAENNKSNLDKADGHSEIRFVLLSPYDKLRLVGRYWPVHEVNKPNAVVLFLHGSGEHCQRYRHVAHFFNKHQIPCVAYDLRGNGLSEGQRGFIPRMDAWLDDLECAIKYIRENLNFTMPLVIYAHGTGCINCLAYILQRKKSRLDCQAMILSTPSICLKERPTYLAYFGSRVVSSLIPGLRLPLNGNYTNEYTDDKEIVAAYRTDPLVHDEWLAQTVCLFLKLGHLLETTEIQFPVPVMIQHGADDNITPIKLIQKWVQERVKGNDVTFKDWPGHNHEIHNDMRRENVFNHALEWIEKRFKIEQN